MFWIQGTASNRCCEFKGEGYTEPRYFGTASELRSGKETGAYAKCWIMHWRA